MRLCSGWGVRKGGRGKGLGEGVGVVGEVRKGVRG